MQNMRAICLQKPQCCPPWSSVRGCYNFQSCLNFSSIGSTGDREFDEADEEDEEVQERAANGGGGGGGGFTAIDMFLAGLGLSQYSKIFNKHQVGTQHKMKQQLLASS